MTEENKAILQYLELFGRLSQTTEDYLYLMDIQKQRSYFFVDIEERFPLKKEKDCPYYHVDDWPGILHPRDRAALMEDTRLVIEGKKPIHNLDYRVRTKQGRYIWMNCRGIIERDEEGRPLLMVGRISENALRYRVDELTGIFNYRQLQEDFSQLLEMKKSGFFLLFGIDNLRNINSRYGYPMGDQALQLLARELEEATDSTKVYRVGSDMFATFLLDVTWEEVETFYVGIQAAVEKHYTLSCGAVFLRISQEADSRQLHRYAEFALEKAKKSGKNSLVFFDAEEYDKEESMVALLEEMRESVAEGYKGFSLVYQPQIRLDDYQIYGAEALIRYESPVRGKVFPDAFIPALEKSELIHPVGLWVLETALAQCQEWRKWLPDFRVSVNVSYVQLSKPEITEQVLWALNHAGLPGSALTLEVTESIQLHDYDHYNEIFSVWKNAGIYISVDDFGTGYSSLSYLKHLDIDEIKIDRSFIRGIQNNSFNYRLLNNTIDLASDSRIHICCEGVETTEELRVLDELEPNILQGYLFARPCGREEFGNTFLAEGTPERCRYDEQIRKLKSSRFGDLRRHSHKEIAEAMGTGIWVMRLNRNTRCHEFYMDDSMRNLLGADPHLSPEEYYCFWRERIRPDCAAYVEDCLKKAICTGKAFQTQYFWHHPRLGEVEMCFMGVFSEETQGGVCLQGSLYLPGRLEQYSLGESAKEETAPAREEGVAFAGIKALQDFFYPLKELVYMTDMDTREIVYINRRMAEKLKVESASQLTGKKCYEALQGCSQACSFCTDDWLVQGEFYEWKFYHPMRQRDYLIKDTMLTHGDKRYRLEIAVDITKSERLGKAMKKCWELDRTVSNGIRFAMEKPGPDASLNCILEYLGMSLNAERVYIFEKNERGGDDNTYEWVGAGVSPEKGNLQDLPMEVCAPWYNRFQHGQPIIIKDVEKIRDADPLIYQALAPQGIHSLVVAPVYIHKTVVGFYGVDNPPEHSLEYVRNVLQTMGWFISSTLQQRNLIRQLQESGQSKGGGEEA